MGKTKGRRRRERKGKGKGGREYRQKVEDRRGGGEKTGV